MYLDYSKLEFDSNGNPEVPELLLKTMGEEGIGVIPGVHNLKLNVKFSEPSEMEFDIPSVIDGEPNWIYDKVSGYKLISTNCYGVYVTMCPTTSADGISEIKHVKAYSIEKMLDSKKFFLEEGTFKFYDLTNPQNGDTIIGRILEKAIGWNPGYISPTLAGRYRTFDGYDDYLLSFMYNTAPQKYRCVFVFDPYLKTISAYDADSENDYGTIPIYLDFDNLITSLEIEEMSDELVTALRPHGADDLDIRAVNPAGTEWMYDLSYFIDNGDIPKTIADKWKDWQQSVLNNRQQYLSLNAMRAAETLRLLSAQAKLADLQGERDALELQRGHTIRDSAMEKALYAEKVTVKPSKLYNTYPLTSASGWHRTKSDADQWISYTYDGGATWTARIRIESEDDTGSSISMGDIGNAIAEKDKEIQDQNALIASIEKLLDENNSSSYPYRINEIISSLEIRKFFTTDEYNLLTKYFIEQDMTDDTFVASDIDVSASGTINLLPDGEMKISGSQITKTTLSSNLKHSYIIKGGSFRFSGTPSITCDIISGTLERNILNKTYVLSLHAGSIVYGDEKSESGILSASGKLSGFSTDIQSVTRDGITTDEGTMILIDSTKGSLFMTANASAYKQYSVGLELYDFAAGVLKDLATPTYEFTVDSGNFVFAREFAPFRNSLALGKGVYLNIGDRTITPYIIEFDLDFEDKSKFSLVFSNRFKRHDNCNTLKDMIEKSYSSSRSFDAGKYLYNQTAGQIPAVSQFMNSALDAAKNMVLGASDQSVVINGSGIHIRGENGNSKYQLRLIDRMIAMTDDNWEHAKLAIGTFSLEDGRTYTGVHADVIGGKLFVGNNLVLENATDDGVMQFKVDSSGAWLNNSTFVLQKDNGGKILIDPKYGIAAGNGNLYTLNGTTVSPSFIDSKGEITLENDMPKNASFYLDIRNGDAYFGGKLYSKEGKIGGFTISERRLQTGENGSFVALNGDISSSIFSPFAIWAGGTNPTLSSCPFWVKKNGEMKATNGLFTGTITASKIKGNLTADDDGWLVGAGIKVGENSSVANGYNFYVDKSGNVTTSGNMTLGGNVTMSGSITLGGNIKWSNTNSPCNVLYARNQSIAFKKPDKLYDEYTNSSSADWHKILNSLDYYASYTYDGGRTWTKGIQIRGEKGDKGEQGEPGKDAAVTRANIVNAMLEANKDDGLYTVNINGRPCLGINATAIRSGIITSIQFKGCEFYDENMKTRMVLGYSSRTLKGGSLALYQGSSTVKSFEIYDDTVGAVTLSAYENQFLRAGTVAVGSKTYNCVPQGTWDFSQATVTGLSGAYLRFAP